jgi:hypothetical protein
LVRANFTFQLFYFVVRNVWNEVVHHENILGKYRPRNV